MGRKRKGKSGLDSYKLSSWEQFKQGWPLISRAGVIFMGLGAAFAFVSQQVALAYVLSATAAICFFGALTTKFS